MAHTQILRHHPSSAGALVQNPRQVHLCRSCGGSSGDQCVHFAQNSSWREKWSGTSHGGWVAQKFQNSDPQPWARVTQLNSVLVIKFLLWAWHRRVSAEMGGLQSEPLEGLAKWLSHSTHTHTHMCVHMYGECYRCWGHSSGQIGKVWSSWFRTESVLKERHIPRPRSKAYDLKLISSAFGAAFSFYFSNKDHISPPSP